MVLVFITTLVSALLVTALVSWLSVATFWLSLAHTQPRLDTEHEVVTSGIMISSHDDTISSADPLQPGPHGDGGHHRGPLLAGHLLRWII